MSVKYYKGSRRRSRGLGDTIEKVAKATGVSKIAETVTKVTGKDCGCKKRKEKLNQAFPYKEKPKKTRQWHI